MALTFLVTRQTALARLLFARGCESDDLGRGASGVDVRLPWAMARFASLPLRTFALSRFRSPVRTVFVTGRLRLMTGLASICADVQRRVGWLSGRIHILGIISTQCA